MDNQKQISRRPIVWGIHMGVHVGNRPIEGGYVGIGYAELGDPRNHTSRESLKTILSELLDVKSGAIPVHAGTVFKFLHEIHVGDYVIYPSKHDRMVNIGQFSEPPEYEAEELDEYPNRRKVEWLCHIPRNEFSQSALNEIGSAVTLFRVKNHAEAFISKIGDVQPIPVLASSEDKVDDEAGDDDVATVVASLQAEENTSDFVVRRIMNGLSGHEFEALVANILECMGYTARITQASADGGVDIIAHLDALGFQPPIVKVQCKRKTVQIPRMDVDQLLGTLGEGEYGLFVSLGSYSRSAVELERNRSKLRLIDGEQFVELLISHYDGLLPRYRSLIPLKQIYVPDLSSL